MAEAAVAERKQSSQDIFDLQIRHVREHVDFHERLNEAKFDKIEALMAKNLAEQKALIGEIHGEVMEMRGEFREMRGEFKNMDARMTRMERDINAFQGELSEVKGDIKAINARFDTLQNKFSWNLAWMGIIIGIVLAVVQHLWK